MKFSVVAVATVAIIEAFWGEEHADLPKNVTNGVNPLLAIIVGVSDNGL